MEAEAINFTYTTVQACNIKYDIAVKPISSRLKSMQPQNRPKKYDSRQLSPLSSSMNSWNCGLVVRHMPKYLNPGTMGIIDLASQHLLVILHKLVRQGCQL